MMHAGFACRVVSETGIDSWVFYGQNATKITELAVKFGGKLDGLIVNHASLEPLKRIADSSVDEWKRLYDINVFSPLALVSSASGSG